MNFIKPTQIALSVALLAGGVLAARAAFAWEGNGFCPTCNNEAVCADSGGFPDMTWGTSCHPGSSSNFVSTSTSNGAQTMIVNLGSSAYSCVWGYGWNTNVGPTCINHDSTNDGSSVTDTGGGCNGANEYFAVACY